MKHIRTLGVALVAALALVAAPAALAQAGTGHHKHDRQVAQNSDRHHSADRHRSHHKAPHGQSHKQTAHKSGKHSCSVAPKCRPAPLTKPKGGWPCAHTGTCASKHHYPICKPGQPRHDHGGHKPGKPSHPGKPGKPSQPSTPDKPSTRIDLTNAHTSSPVPNVDRLAFTGVNLTETLGLAALLLGSGIALAFFGLRRRSTQD